MNARPIIALLICAMLPVLSGCAGAFQFRSTQFHNMPDVVNKTFVIVPLSEANNGSIEFRTYAAECAALLGKKGMIAKPLSEFGRTDFIVALDYAVANGRQRSYTTNVYGQTGGGSQQVSGTVTSGSNTSQFYANVYSAPEYGVVSSQVHTETVFDQAVRVLVFDGAATDGRGFVKRYEGRAQGVGRSDDLTRVVPAGLRALLADFPGQTGKSITRTVQLD